MSDLRDSRSAADAPELPAPIRASTRSRTTTALLAGLADPADDAAWSELFKRCAPLMRQAALRLGIAVSDADDVVQIAFARFIEAWRRGQYDRSRGRLSSFLLTILRSRAIEHLRARPRVRVEPLASDDAPFEAVNDEVLERFWMQARQQQILEEALDHLRGAGVEERSLTAFTLYAVRGLPVDDVASQLSMTRADVYNAKYRLTRLLQPVVARLDESYEDL